MRISDWSSDVCSSDLLPSRPAPTHHFFFLLHRAASAQESRDCCCHKSGNHRALTSITGERSASVTFGIVDCPSLPVCLGPGSSLIQAYETSIDGSGHSARHRRRLVAGGPVQLPQSEEVA